MNQHQQHLFGRAQELVETDAALAAAASGQPRVVLVAGDAGIGKTALVSAMMAQAHERGFTPLTGHCLDIETGVPLDPVREAFRNALAGRRVDTLPPVTRRLAPYLGITSDADTGSPMSLLGDLRMAVSELAREAPLMLVLEDMQWADRSTQDFALAVARTARDRTVLVAHLPNRRAHPASPVPTCARAISGEPKGQSTSTSGHSTARHSPHWLWRVAMTLTLHWWPRSRHGARATRSTPRSCWPADQTGCRPGSATCS